MNTPVVIGSSVTGLLISRALSRAGHRHILLGADRPGQDPRLGESMNETASLACSTVLDPSLRAFYFPKSHISLFNGEVVSRVQFDRPDRELVPPGAGRGPTPYRAAVKSTLHIDRVPFDQALYDLVRADPLCDFRLQMCTGIGSEHDRITTVKLDEGRALSPSYVFDATGPRCVVGSAMGVGRSATSSRQRVVWTRLHSGGTCADAPWWRHGTNLVKLDLQNDGIRAIAWVIPLGEVVSIGMSLDAAHARAIDDEALSEQMIDAFERRGIELRRLFPEPDRILSLEHDYGIRDRAHGANWLLAGASFMQVWFPSSSGMATSLAAAELAPRLLTQPELGALYGETMRTYQRFHAYLETMIDGPTHAATAHGMSFWSGWLADIPVRMAESFDLKDDPSPRRFVAAKAMRAVSAACRYSASLQLFLWGFGFIRSVHEPQLSNQSAVFGPYRHHAAQVTAGMLTLWPRYYASRIRAGKAPSRITTAP